MSRLVRREQPTRPSQELDLPNSYEPFVRGVLTRLSADLSSGRLSIRQEGGGVRYVVEAPGHSGRNIVVPNSNEALEAPHTLPPRSVCGLLSKLKLIDTNGEQVNVPKHAIVRDHKLPIPAREMAGVCRGCEFGTCPHGWKNPHPVTVVVLRLRNSSGFDAYGWYVRFSDKPNQLVRIPKDIVSNMEAEFSDDGHMQNSTLVTRYEDCITSLDWDTSCDGESFHTSACARFALFRKRAAAAAHKDRKRKERSPESSTACGGETCVICLEEHPTSQKRCRHDHCGTHVCDKCHSDSRGLCPVCDRSSINADYPCSSCHRLTRLSQYGYPCTACASHSLCAHCYGSFSACGSCD